MLCNDKIILVKAKTSRNKPYCNSKWKSGKCDVSKIYRSKVDFPIKNIKCEMAQAELEGLLNFFQLCFKIRNRFYYEE